MEGPCPTPNIIENIMIPIFLFKRWEVMRAPGIIQNIMISIVFGRWEVMGPLAPLPKSLRA